MKKQIWYATYDDTTQRRWRK